MKLLHIWEKLGKQPLKMTKYTDAIVYVGDEEYFITNIKYVSGKPLGFDAIKIGCETCKNNVEFPPPHTCDECTSLANDDWCMWERKKEKKERVRV